MEYTQTYHELKHLFSLKSDIIPLNSSGLQFNVMEFESSSDLTLPLPADRAQAEKMMLIAQSDAAIAQNRRFRYPVITPSVVNPHGRAIVLLHGLNERAWLKYLPWAYFLAIHTARPVILFPIAFHMNRSPESWANPREMSSLLKVRQAQRDVSLSTFANAALSQRLSEEPFRFFASGKQSADDLVSLLESIKGGDYPLLKRDSQVDFFAYSIGAFLSQVLFIANPRNLLSNSRLFLFCGGAHFSEMFGASRLIMDSGAYASLRRYYLHSFLNDIRIDGSFSDYFGGDGFGGAFLSMLSPESNRDLRMERLRMLGHRLMAVSLRNDRVIPSHFVKSSLSCIAKSGRGVVNELDFPYSYTHETPFPIGSNSDSAQVDRSFERVFKSAVDFLM
ncbi:MAG: hypothetical protein H6536_08845 [Bacteroidales bacterium]|nr:hypothetical protein [Bacteroidales bacterium]